MRRNFKKLIVLLLVFTMTISLLAGCKKDDTQTGGEVKATPTPAVDENDPTPTEAPIKDLGGTEITIANWWVTDPPQAPRNQREEDTLAYRQAMMEKHNFTIKEINIGTWGEYQEIVVTSIMTGDPAADIFIMDQQFVSAPVQQGLLYPLNTLENFNFSDEKWNQQVLELMTFQGKTFGMASGRMEPRLGVFWNKRMFEEAGVEPDLPYDLQAKNEWTWDALKDLAIANTRDLNNDGTPDVYGISSFSIDFFRGVVFSNNAKFIGVNDEGKFYNATSEANFLEALQWGRSLYDEGYHMPQPEGSNWDWFISTFKEGKVAMQVAEQYKVNTWKDMEDDWGFVLFPRGPQGEMITIFTENIVVMPYNHSKERAEEVAFAYNLWTNVVPGYEDEDWRTNFYPVFRDARAVQETLPLFYEPKHARMSYVNLVNGVNYGDITFDLDAGALTPAECVEKVLQSWQTFIDRANGVE